MNLQMQFEDETSTLSALNRSIFSDLNLRLSNIFTKSWSSSYGELNTGR